MNNENGIVTALNTQYDRYGYSRYKMSKFEEYDLYANNKDFLISDGVITFTDRNGKLMALKPDVTLSIVKNTAGKTDVQKLYYNENVYRVSKSTHNFKEIMQVGLECIGSVDGYCTAEVIALAASSLAVINGSAVLCVSDLDLLIQTLESVGVAEDKRDRALKLIGEKNLHGLRELTDEAGAELFKDLLSIKGDIKTAAGQVKELLEGKAGIESLLRFESVIDAVSESGYADMIKIDMSVVGDINYYNGFVFKGYVESVPAAVLSGGQYDRLMVKMKRDSKAIGFAVYLDLLERLGGQKNDYDCDILVLYTENTDISTLMSTVDSLVKGGSAVSVRRSEGNVKYKKLLKFD